MGGEPEWVTARAAQECPYLLDRINLFFQNSQFHLGPPWAEEASGGLNLPHQVCPSQELPGDLFLGSIRLSPTLAEGQEAQEEKGPAEGSQSVCSSSERPEITFLAFDKKKLMLSFLHFQPAAQPLALPAFPHQP